METRLVIVGTRTLEDVTLRGADWYAAQGVDFRRGVRVADVDTEAKIVHAADGTTQTYDTPLICTGSRPRRLPLPGADLEGVLGFRDLADVSRLPTSARVHTHAIVIRGGQLGLEAAHGMATRTEADLGDERVTGVRFASGEEIPADLVVIAVGIVPNRGHGPRHGAQDRRNRPRGAHDAGRDAELDQGRRLVRKPMCPCTDRDHDTVRRRIVALELRSIPAVMEALGWREPEGCARCRPALNYERLHASIQKDGTYSVVAPTPSWADLGAAGFASGHAYVKAARTVKTCAGSEWCRLGVQDSTALGQRLERMTWGAWARHKFKLAVSGCPRSCAVATIKGLGVVSVESGFGDYDRRALQAGLAASRGSWNCPRRWRASAANSRAPVIGRRRRLEHRGHPLLGA